MELCSAGDHARGTIGPDLDVFAIGELHPLEYVSRPREDGLAAVVEPNADSLAAVQDFGDHAKVTACRAVAPPNETANADLHR
jgi:hypothetical protein